MFFNPASKASASSSNNNNNPNQPNANNPANMFLQPSAFGSQNGGGSGLFGNPQPSVSIFGNASQQTRSSSFTDRDDIQRNGTVEYIGFNQISMLPRNRDAIALVALTARNTRLSSYSSDELRMADYLHLKNNTLSLEQKSVVNNIIRTNLNCFGSSSLHSHFPGGLPPNLSALFGEPSQNPSNSGGNTSGSLFTNPQPSAQNTQPVTTQVVPASGGLFMNSSQITPSPLITNNTQPSDSQSQVPLAYPEERKKFAIAKPKTPSQATAEAAQEILKADPKKQALESNKKRSI